MLRKIRICLAVIFFVGITLLFLDISGVLHVYLGWMAKFQFLPALMAMNVVVVLALLLLTLVLGRVYCSVVCPLGVMQDLFAWLGGKFKKNRYSYSPAKTVLRWIVVAVCVVAFFVGAGSLVALVAPYSSYGRIAQNLLQPLYVGVNNLLAIAAEHYDSYAFYEVDVWVRSWATFAVALSTFIVLVYLSVRSGRTYCNTICPVGTLLGAVSRYSILAPVIDRNKCISCRLCEKNCKASCIDIKGGKRIDGSRCVSCMDCIDRCPKGAISYKLRNRKDILPEQEPQKETSASPSGENMGRRTFVSLVGLTLGGVAMAQKDKLVDGGLTVLENKVPPKRTTPLVPPGALSIANFRSHCTGCQLCVAQCPNGVLRPSTDLMSLMQPEMSFERGYCRPECTRCSEVCPAGAIRPITKEDKSSVQIGHAVVVQDRCIVRTDGVKCGNCARHCPVGAIRLVRMNPDDKSSLMVPAVMEERCIGCGACENLCPANPLSAIYVEGHEAHKFN